MARKAMGKNRFNLKSEKGAVLVWMAVFIVISVGFASLVVDVGRINVMRSDMQKACDAAALAGARRLPNEAACLTAASNLAKYNGYENGVAGVNVAGIHNPDGLHNGWYRVQITKPINYFFAPVLGYTDGNLTIGATASFLTMLPLNIAGSLSQYGTNGIMNLSLFGPYGYYSYGDAYSTQWLNNGAVNPKYDSGGYNFLVNIPNDYVAKNNTSQVKFEIFDPGCWNVGNALNAGAGKVDEIRPAPPSPHPQPASQYTTTRYQLFAPDNTPNNYDDDVKIAEFSLQKGEIYDMQWVSMSGWQVNLATYGTGQYRINTLSTGGSSENGFNLRAGPPLTGGQTFNPNNGTQIYASGHLPINFNVSGTVNINLGYVPAAAAGSNVYVNKFDTDVGSQSILYYDDYGHTWPGILATDGQFKLDTLAIPTGFPGGTLHAKYIAGSQDTSSWEMYFDGYSTDGEHELKLVE